MKNSTFVLQMADDALGMDVDEEEVEQPSSSNVKGDRKRFEVKKVNSYSICSFAEVIN